MPVLRLVKGPGAKRVYARRLGNAAGDAQRTDRPRRACLLDSSLAPLRKPASCDVVAGDQGLALTDEESKAGTFVNGVRLKPHAAHALRHRDRIEICGYTFVYQAETPQCARCVSDEDTGSPEPDRPDVTSVLDGSTTTWLMRTDVHSQPKLLALMQLTKELRKTTTLEGLLSSVLDGLLTLHAQADRAGCCCSARPGRAGRR